MSDKHWVEHPFPPVYNEASRVLILGSLPSVRSRQEGFFYGHPRNRFWQVLSLLLGEPLPQTIAQKRALLLRRHVALWDVVSRCEIVGSSDASIRSVTPSDLRSLVASSAVTHIFLNGQTAARVYRRYQADMLALPCSVLPSTSPANAACSLPRLLTAWQVVADALNSQTAAAPTASAKR